MLASLPMYERVELSKAHESFWNCIKTNLENLKIACPEKLQEGAASFKFWTNPNLVLSQTCGYPYRITLHGKLSLVGTPDYGLENCPEGYYCSHFVVRKTGREKSFSDYRNSKFAFNATNSQSGYVAAQQHAANFGFQFENTVETGAHSSSAKAVATKNADIACIDAVTWKFICRYDAFAKDLEVIASTLPTPGLPYICGLSTNAELVFDAISAAINQLDSAHRKALSIKKLVYIKPETYLALNQQP